MRKLKFKDDDLEHSRICLGASSHLEQCSFHPILEVEAAGKRGKEA